MKKRHFFHLVFLCLILTLNARISTLNAMGGFPQSALHSYFFNGGLSVVIQGLSEAPIEVAYPNQSAGAEITVTIYNWQGEVWYQETTFETELDYESLSLPDGEKTLVVEVGSESETIVLSD